MHETVETLITYCRENRRVCPLPILWNQLWQMLPERKRVGAGYQPSAPLILGAWNYTSAVDKMLRLSEHIEWADNHSALAAIATFLRNLREEDWHHLGDH